mmetsp:Transcript_11783/g.41263  ORF Transcript_11783/g.41263 Transcript_11783/m.41263 type:complete len:204 (-) Transcript_11783:436-1047(-)
MKPSCAFGRLTSPRSHSGDTARPSSRSRSPCLKNSSVMRVVHCKCSGSGLLGCPTSQHLSTMHMTAVAVSSFSSPGSWSVACFMLLTYLNERARSVASTSSMMSLRSSKRVSRSTNANRSSSSVRISRKASLTCMFSNTDMSFHVIASSLPVVVRNLFDTPGCLKSCTAAAMSSASLCSGSSSRASLSWCSITEHDCSTSVPW